MVEVKLVDGFIEATWDEADSLKELTDALEAFLSEVHVARAMAEAIFESGEQDTVIH